jgi:hypothetical protein
MSRQTQAELRILLEMETDGLAANRETKDIDKPNEHSSQA